MRYQKLPARVAAVLLGLCLTAGILGAPALAADSSGPPETVDYSRTGSITVRKYTEDSSLDSGADLTQEQLAEYIQSHPDELTPLPDVIFRYVKVADIEQYTKAVVNEDAVTNVVKLGYAVDQATAEFLGLTGEDADVLEDGTMCYDASTLDEALNRRTATETETFAAAQDAAYMPATDADGMSTVSGLDLGLYLVCEWSYPATATADADHCAPFLVSLPSTDGNSWVYDMTVAPKNMTALVRNDKVIVGTDGNETKEYDAEINEAVQFLVRSDVPNAIGKLKTYQLIDTLSAGLTYDEGTATVYGVADDGIRTELTLDEDFILTVEDNTLTWAFNPASLADAEGWAAYDSVEVYYTAHLNENAVIGGEGNPNELRTVYSKSTNTDSDALVTVVPEECPRLYTYAIHVHKVDGDTGAALAGVTFELQDADGAEVPVSEAAPGEYYLDPEGDATLTTGEDGELLIKGVQADTYYLDEIAAPEGYRQLADKIKVVITSNENTYTQDANGTYAVADPEQSYCTDVLPSVNYFILPLDGDGQGTVPAGTYVCFGTPSAMTLPDGGQVEMYKADQLTWSANYAMGGRDGADSGIVKLEVINNRIPLPKTGGDGDHLALVIGSCVICAGAILFALSFVGKRRKTSEN